MTDNAKRFFRAASSDEALRDELKDAQNFESVAKVASSHGFTLTDDDLKAANISTMS